MGRIVGLVVEDKPKAKATKEDKPKATKAVKEK
jgi:hypothetical protein